jgi:hypothetical protein
MCAFEATVPIDHTRRQPIQQTELSNLKYAEVHISENNRTLAKLFQPIDRTASTIISLIKMTVKRDMYVKNSFIHNIS